MVKGREFAPDLPVRPRYTPHRWVRTNFGPAHTTEPPGHKPLVVNGVVVGPFEEEEEGTGIVSEVVKVKCAESGHPRSPDSGIDTGTAISPISCQQKQSNTRSRTRKYLYPKRCGQSAGLLILRSSVRFRQKLQKLRTQILMDLRYIDPQARVLNYFYK